MKTLKNCIKLGSQVKIFVPSTIKVFRYLESKTHWVDEALSLLSDCFGGATSTKALGAWVSSKGDLIKEDVNLVFAYAQEKQLEENIERIYDFCLDMKKQLEQEAIALEVNGNLYLL